jgi:AcrR family transcriptional regulator
MLATDTVNDPDRTTEHTRTRNRRGEGDRLRRQLLDAAGRLLEQGATHETLSLRAVAREVGIAATSVYLHFADRTELLIAVYRERFAELARALEEAIAEAPDPAAQLRACCLAYHRFALQYPSTYRVLFEVPGARQEVPPALRRDQLPGVELFDTIRACLDRCVEAGVAPRTDPFLATTCLLAGLHGLVTLRINRPSFPWPSMEALVDHLLATQVGLRSADASP